MVTARNKAKKSLSPVNYSAKTIFIIINNKSIDQDSLNFSGGYSNGALAWKGLIDNLNINSIRNKSDQVRYCWSTKTFLL